MIEDEDPKTYKVAMFDMDYSKWVDAMKAEMESMYHNKVRTFIDPPNVANPSKCKWIYKIKCGADGNVETFKTRLVPKGYTQEEGIDHEEFFFSCYVKVHKNPFIATYCNYEIWQMDDNTTFLGGYLKEEIHMH